MRYIDCDCASLIDDFIKILNVKVKKNIQLACTSRIIFTGKTNNNDNQYQLSKSSLLFYIKKGIFIDCLASESLQIKWLIKAILASLF